MSEKGGNILLRLWANVDQADFDLMIDDAFKSVSTAKQKEYIARLLNNNSFLGYSDLDEKELAEYRRYVSE